MVNVRELRVHGSPVVVLENEMLSLSVAAGKGADIVSLVHRPTDTELLWRSPAGLDALRESDDRIRYIGGWIETFPNAWSECVHRGRKLSGYGDVWQLPWTYEVLRDDGETAQVAFSVASREVPLELTKRIAVRAGSGVVRIDETAVNVGNEPVAFTWGHHPNLGRPFLDEDCTVELPACEIWDDGRRIGEWPYIGEGADRFDLRTVPRYGSSTENRQVFLRKLAESKAAVTNKRTGLSFRLAWDGATFTDMLLWRAFDTTAPSELFGDYQIVCLFPKRGLDNVADAAAKDEAIVLEPGEALSAWIEAEVGMERRSSLRIE